jgi:DNA mismatch endonuclease (patch repair protein)
MLNFMYNKASMVDAQCKIYIRDKRSPKPKNETVSRVMSANKSINTAPELQFRKALREKGIIDYYLHSYKLPGKPDIIFPKKKIVIFINGCYWHRCRYCDLPLPKSNKKFWKNKFRKNIERDKTKKDLLKKNGWQVLVIWECQIKKGLPRQVDRIIKKLES